MNLCIRLMASAVAFVAFAAEAADISGSWSATITTAAGSKDYQYTFRQNGADLIGTIRSKDGVVAISNGYINNKMVTFTETVTVEGRRGVIDYTGELVSDNEIKFKRQAAGPAVEFVAKRSAARQP